MTKLIRLKKTKKANKKNNKKQKKKKKKKKKLCNCKQNKTSYTDFYKNKIEKRKTPKISSYIGQPKMSASWKGF